MVTYLELDILECEVKWTLGSITENKASRGNGIPVELFQLKVDAVRVLHSICQQIEKLSSGRRTGKGLFSFQSLRKAMPKNAQTTAQLHSSYTSNPLQYSCLENPRDRAAWWAAVYGFTQSQTRLKRFSSSTTH